MHAEFTPSGTQQVPASTSQHMVLVLIVIALILIVPAKGAVKCVWSTPTGFLLHGVRAID